MKTWIIHFWERLRTGFWFVPALFAGGAIGFSQLFMWADESWGAWLSQTFPDVTIVSPDSVRQLMSTVATSTLSLAGITISGTLVALTLASGQFGPRMLRTFIRARTTQVTLAMLLSTFVYCLLVLRGIRSGPEMEFVPHLSALVGFVSALASLGAFIVFIHYLATSLQADRLTAAVFRDLKMAIDRFFPNALPTDHEESKADAESDEWEELEDESAIESKKDGYLQAVNLKGLITITNRLKLRCRVLKRPGHFISQGVPILAFPGSAELDDKTLNELHGCLIIGSERTPEQDFEHEIRQLVEIALRALSPGINDPFTAISCIDFLGAAASQIARRKLPPRYHQDSEGITRVQTRPASFESILDECFHQIRQAGCGMPAIAIRLLESLAVIDRQCLTNRQREAVLKHVRLIETETQKAGFPGPDQDDIEKRLRVFKLDASAE